jgi:hypothetical protein
MTDETKLFCGIVLITVPTVEYGGYFLLSLLSGRHSSLDLSEFQKSMYRAGHAHAGVLIILSMVCQILVDYATLFSSAAWLVRVGVPVSALLISGGFFFSAMKPGCQEPGRLVWLIYAGIGVLAISLITLGIGLLLK